VARTPELGDRVVFVSGGAFTPQLEEFMREAGRPWLPKPFSANELRAYVASFLAERARR
jgi:hypothetical protein